MQPLAADLRDEDMRQFLATYYAGLRPPADEPSAVDAALVEERAHRLALEGAPEAGAPPCMACHGDFAGGAPRLTGQHAAYMAGATAAPANGTCPRDLKCSAHGPRR